MEPQLEGCGKGINRRLHERHTTLQWSRNLRVAERAAMQAADARDVELQWSRNLRVAERAWTR